ncbi:MAG: NAD(P)H-hydrate dehydratase [Deltaproteobacteria bacterium]|jgi:NAD(P)H-hydrate epimerase|nr:NAD(P)H-hydrate dehydratase [Deltaproteobacteria bacterium]
MTAEPPETALPARPLYVAAPEESREIDRRAIEVLGIPGIVLMENAARSIVAHAEEFWPELSHRSLQVAVIGGQGQNGGDGWAVARILSAMGHSVRCWLVSEGGKEPEGDAAITLRTARAMGIPVGLLASPADPLPDWNYFGLIVDAVFGTGLSRPLRDPAARVLASLRKLPPWTRTLAVDLPSGVSGADGKALGPAPRADLTVALGTFKPGHFMGDGFRLSGALRLGDIGLVPEAFGESPPLGSLLGRARAALLAPPRPAWGHKGTFGHAFLAGGTPGKSGALALAATAALRAGAGLVTAACPEALASLMDARLTAPMCLALPQSEEGELCAEAAGKLAERIPPWRGALGLGPGLGRTAEAGAFVREIVRLLPDAPLVLDADALDPASGALKLLKGRKSPAVVTPHPGEAARILDLTAPAVEEDRLAAARAISRELGAVTVLKGSRTVIMAPDGGRFLINLGGGPVLAAGGSGDLLTGVVTGLLARGMAPFEAAALAVYVHAEAGDLAAKAFGPQGISPMEFQRYIPLALSSLSGFEPDPAVPAFGGPMV